MSPLGLLFFRLSTPQLPQLLLLRAVLETGGALACLRKTKRILSAFLSWHPLFPVFSHFLHSQKPKQPHRADSESLCHVESCGHQPHFSLTHRSQHAG